MPVSNSYLGALERLPRGMTLFQKPIPDSIRPSYTTVVDLLKVHICLYLFVRMISMWPHMCTVYVSFTYHCGLRGVYVF